MQVVDSIIQSKFHVQLQKYENYLNLKYVADKSVSPYCCCYNSDICFKSTSDSNVSCPGQCMLKFTLCASLPWSNATKETGADLLSPHCYMSEVDAGPPIIKFDCLMSNKHYFPSQPNYPQFPFSLEIDSQMVRTFNKSVYLHLYNYVVAIQHVLNISQMFKRRDYFVSTNI